MIAGLGIDFNPQPSPQPSSNREAHFQKPSPPTGDHATAALVGRRVRIVSASNTYHNYEQESETAANGCTVQELHDNVNLDHTAMSVRSMTTESSGSSTRHHNTDGVAQVLMLPSTNTKTQDFEASLSRKTSECISDATACYNLDYMDMEREAHLQHQFYKPTYPTSDGRTKALTPKAKPSLKRASAMSRPKSMMELSQLYAYQSKNGTHLPDLPAPGMHLQPQSMARQQSSSSCASQSTSPSSISTEDSCGISNHDGHSTAPSSVFDSTEAKPIRHFPVASTIHRQQSDTRSGPRAPQLTKARSAMSMRSTVSTASSAGSSRSARSVVSMYETEALRQQMKARAEDDGRTGAQRASAARTDEAAKLLHRQGTLLSTGTSPAKRTRELNNLLAPKHGASRGAPSVADQSCDSSTISSQAVFSPGGTHFNAAQLVGGTSGYQPGLKRKASTVVLEQASKDKARVEMDLVLASSTVVEGGYLKGKMEIRVRPPRNGQGEVWLGTVKARVVGFEELANDEARHVFYHHSGVVEGIDPSSCYASAPDEEGFCKGKVGNHAFPLSLHLPVGLGAKGSLKNKHGVVKYIVIGSVKLKSKREKERSIAHFYRNIEVYPYLDPSFVLAPSAVPIQADTCKSLFMGGDGKVNLTASLHREHWVAGQACYVNIQVSNQASKKIKNLTVSLIQTSSVHPGGTESAEGMGQTIKKKVAESTLEMGKKSTRGNVTAKGAWMGVEKGESAEFCHLIQIPHDALTVPRSRFLAVNYAIKVAVGGTLSSDICVELPLTIVSFISIDPPPGHQRTSLPSRPAAELSAKPRSTHEDSHEQSSHATASRTLTSMPSMDFLCLQDLNRLYITPHNTDCADSAESCHDSAESDTGHSMMSRAYTMPSIEECNELSFSSPILPPVASAVIARARERQLRHQMSLDCIGSAIASATAKKSDPAARTISPLNTNQRVPQEVHCDSGDVDVYGEEITTADEIYQHYYDEPGQHAYPTPLPEPAHIRLEDLEDIPDDEVYYGHVPDGSSTFRVMNPDLSPTSPTETSYIEYENESEDEVDLVLQTRHFESLAGDDTGNTGRFNNKPGFGPNMNLQSPRKFGAHTLATRSPARSALSPGLLSEKSGPPSPVSSRVAVKSLTTMVRAEDKEQIQFGLASRSSPIKKGQAPIVSPRQKQVQLRARPKGPVDDLTSQASTASAARIAQQHSSCNSAGSAGSPRRGFMKTPSSTALRREATS